MSSRYLIAPQVHRPALRLSRRCRMFALRLHKGETGMKKLGMLMAGACAFVLMQAATAGQTSPTDRKSVEAAFDAGVSAQDQLDWLKQMSSAPNQVGSPH